jgi:replicative DNA helicase
LPYDADAEVILVSGAIVFPEQTAAIAPDISPEHFYSSKHAALWAAACQLAEAGIKADHVVLADWATRLGIPVDPQEVIALLTSGIPPTRGHVEIILRRAAARRALAIASELQSDISEGNDPYAAASAAAGELDAVATDTSSEPEAIPMADLIASAEGAAPWVIPGLLRQDWRAIVVASEGIGKSTLLRQIAMLPAQGIHPLSFKLIEPVQTLVVDAENPQAAIAETGSVIDTQLRKTVGNAYDKARCVVWSRPGGLNLREPRIRGEFIRELRTAQPRLVVAGPVYKLAGREKGESYEEAAEAVLAILDDLRTRFRFALLLEHHAPKQQNGFRDLNPFGSQRWLAWPELGITLKSEKDSGRQLVLGRFRGDRLRSHWPERVDRGKTWPFEGRWSNGLQGDEGEDF